MMNIKPIDYDVDMDRFYIPVNSRYEIQTKGKGSSFRIANTVTHERHLVSCTYVQAMLEDMAKGTHAELMQQQAEITSLREQLEIAKKDGWISVDTALPELRDDSVLAHFANGSIETIHIEDYFRQITDGFDSNGNQKYTRWYLHSNPLVTHWQPLPDPPKD